MTLGLRRLEELRELSMGGRWGGGRRERTPASGKEREGGTEEGDAIGDELQGLARITSSHGTW